MRHVSLNANAFRTLGLDTDAPFQTILERANELRTYLGIQHVPTYPTDYVVFAPPKRTIETVTAALSRMEDPLTRLFDEATWFHLRDAVDESAAAALTEGSLSQAASLWEAALDQATYPAIRLHYQHNFAVLHLAAADIPGKLQASPLDTWDRALSSWTALITSDDFWQHLVAKSPAGQDPRCPPEAVGEVRTAIGNVLASGCTRRAVKALRNGYQEEAFAWAAALATNQFPVEFTAPAVEEVLEAVGELIRTHLEPVQAVLREGEQGHLEIEGLENRLNFAATTFEQFRELRSENTPALRATADLLAETHRSLALYYGNQANNPTKALQHIESAVRITASQGLRVRLQQDAQTLHSNIAINAFNAAVEARDYVRAKRAFEELEQYEGSASSGSSSLGTSGPNAVESFRKALQMLRVFQDCEPITEAPSLSTFNGIGTQLYGWSEWDPETETYLATLFFTVLFIPLIPIKRYRVRDVGSGRYQFYGKVPLTKVQKAWTVAVALAGAVSLLYAGVEGYRSTPSPRASYRTTPAPNLNTRAALRAEINRRRQELEAERAALEAERQAIDRNILALEDLQAEIEGGRASRQLIEEYNDSLNALKAQAEDYDARVDAWNRKRTEFNTFVNRYNTNR